MVRILPEPTAIVRVVMRLSVFVQTLVCLALRTTFSLSIAFRTIIYFKMGEHAIKLFSEQLYVPTLVCKQ